MTLQSRAALDTGLAELNSNILSIASMVDKAIECAMEALYQSRCGNGQSGSGR